MADISTHRCARRLRRFSSFLVLRDSFPWALEYISSFKLPPRRCGQRFEPSNRAVQRAKCALHVHSTRIVNKRSTGRILLCQTFFNHLKSSLKGSHSIIEHLQSGLHLHDKAFCRHLLEFRGSCRRLLGGNNQWSLPAVVNHPLGGRR